MRMLCCLLAILKSNVSCVTLGLILGMNVSVFKLLFTLTTSYDLSFKALLQARLSRKKFSESRMFTCRTREMAEWMWRSSAVLSVGQREGVWGCLWASRSERPSFQRKTAPTSNHRGRSPERNPFAFSTTSRVKYSNRTSHALLRKDHSHTLHPKFYLHVSKVCCVCCFHST